MKPLFTNDVLQRSTYPFERQLPGPIADYHSLLTDLQRTLPRKGAVRFLFQEFASRLACRSQTSHDGNPPEWVSFFPQLAGRAEENSTEVMRKLEQHCRTEAYSHPFLAAAGHFLNAISESLRGMIVQNAQEAILLSLAKWYLGRMTATARFVLHVDYSRSRLGYSEWLLGFESAEPRFNRWFSIAGEYPVLMRWLAGIHRNCLARACELLARLKQDRELIAAEFQIKLDDKISNLQLGLSDPHRGGRSVGRLEFASGASLIYKPKPLELDAALYHFVSARGKDSGVVPLAVLPRNEYGWVQDVGGFLRRGPSLKNPQAIGNAGMLFWLLNATDLHSENVLSTEEGVFALDLETLLLPSASDTQAGFEASWRNHSIYKTLLFETSFGGNRQNISGFFPSADLKLGPQVRFRLADNDVVIERQQTTRKNTFAESPALRAPRHAASIAKRIAASFRAAQSVGRPALCEFVAGLADTTIARIVLRDTSFYSRILNRMRQPRHLRDGARMCADLFSLHLAVQDAAEDQQAIHTLIEDEIQQLLQGDIPYFSCEVGGRDLITSCGQLKEFFSLSGKDHSREKIENFQTSDVEEQVSLIQISLGCYPAAPAAIAPESEGLDGGRQIPCFERDLFKFAEGLILAAFRPENGPARWISMFGDVSGNESRVDIGDPGFFSGAWGILLALQAVQHAVGQEFVQLNLFLDEQASRWRQCLEELALRDTKPVQRLLGYCGIGGEVFAQSVLISLNRLRWGFLQPYAGKSLIEARSWIRQDKLQDVIGGAAGLILGCDQFLRLKLHNKWRTAAKKTLQASAKQLLLKSQSFHGGLAWTIPGEKHPLLAYAHGWAGVYAALNCARQHASNSLEKSSIEDCLQGAALFPAGLLDAYSQWFDFRFSGSDPTSLNRSWCHGRPGILRGLLVAKPHWKPAVARTSRELFEEMVELFNTTDVYRYCCGEMGNADLFFDLPQCASFEADASIKARAAAVSRRTASLYLEDCTNAEPEKIFPGLFHGRAGVVYTAARTLLPQLPSLSGQNLIES